MKTCIVIPAMLVDENLFNMTSRFIDSIYKRTVYPNYEVLIYDNNSEPNLTEKLVDKIKNITDGIDNKNKFRIIKLGSCRFNMSLTYNMALKDSDAELFINANNDMEIINAEWLTNIVKWFEITPNLGLCIPFQDILGDPLTTNPVNTLKDSGDMCWFSIYGILRKTINDIGGFDENVDLFFHDFDVYYTVRCKGFKALWAYNAIVRHYGDRTTVNHPKSSKHSYNEAYHYVHKKHPGK